MNTLKLPCNVGEVSDGYHTFNELYEHRHALMLALMKCNPERSWISPKHDDGTMMDGWFIVGIDLPDGAITYHLPVGLWSQACDTNAELKHRAPKWDGHTSQDVVKRLHDFLKR
jgi:hypothetical protein